MHQTHSERLGDCPECRTPIPARNRLISYERADGPATYAECPDCGDPVHPT